MSEYKPTRTLLLDLDMFAETVDHLMGDAFLLPHPGVFINGEEKRRENLDCVFAPTGREIDLWQESGDPIAQLTDINSQVYNRDDICVLSFADFNKGWGTSPSVPLAARLICESYLRDAMISQLRYVTPKRFRYKHVFGEWVSPQSLQNGYVDNRIQELLVPLHDQVVEFINGPTFDMHVMTRRDGLLTLEKYDDWRVYEYYRMIKKPYQR